MAVVGGIKKSTPSSQKAEVPWVRVIVIVIVIVRAIQR